MTLMVHLEPAATLDPQVLVCAKSPAFVPEIETLETVRAALPEFVRVTDWEALLLFIAWLPNEMLDGETLIPAAAPVPVRVTV